jgi:hypothetical protein
MRLQQGEQVTVTAQVEQHLVALAPPAPHRGQEGQTLQEGLRERVPGGQRGQAPGGQPQQARHPRRPSS